jgi:hypothetical protein
VLSGVLELTDAVFDTSPALVGVTSIVTDTSPPLAIVPSAHVTVPLPEQEPCEALDATNVNPAGNVSVTVVPIAESGPALWTASVYRSVLPTTPWTGAAVLVIDRSAADGAVTVTSVLAELFPATGSVDCEDTDTALCSVPAAVGVTCSVIVADLPLNSETMLQVSVPPGALSHEPVGLMVAESNVTPEGSVSVTVIPAAAVLALSFLTVIVYSSGVPAATDPADATLLTDTSAWSAGSLITDRKALRAPLE